MDSESKKQPATDDRSLVERAKRGDLDAFDELVRRYHGQLISFLRYYNSENTDVEDVAQEAFLKCFIHLDQFDPERKFKNWLYTIARRTIPRLQTRADGNGAMLDGLIGKAVDPQTVAELSDQSDLIWTTVRNATSDDEFQVMWYRYAEQFSLKEIACVMQRSEAAIKMQLSRLRKRLRRHLLPFAGTEHVANRLDPKLNGATI